MLRWVPALQLMTALGVMFLSGRVMLRTLPVLREWRERRFDLGSSTPPLLPAVAFGVSALCLLGTVVAFGWLVVRLFRA